MAADIVPELYKAIECDFEMRVNTTPDIRAFNKKLSAGSAKLEDPILLF